MEGFENFEFFNKFFKNKIDAKIIQNLQKEIYFTSFSPVFIENNFKDFLPTIYSPLLSSAKDFIEYKCDYVNNEDYYKAMEDAISSIALTPSSRLSIQSGKFTEIELKIDLSNLREISYFIDSQFRFHYENMDIDKRRNLINLPDQKYFISNLPDMNFIINKFIFNTIVLRQLLHKYFNYYIGFNLFLNKLTSMQLNKIKSSYKNASSEEKMNSFQGQWLGFITPTLDSKIKITREKKIIYDRRNKTFSIFFNLKTPEDLLLRSDNNLIPKFMDYIQGKCDNNITFKKIKTFRSDEQFKNILKEI